LSPHHLGAGHCVTTLKPLPCEAFAATAFLSPSAVTLLQVFTLQFNELSHFNDGKSIRSHDPGRVNNTG
jgi:hypothetical protein